MQVVIASLNEKSTEDSSSNKDSAVKSDEEEVQELAEEEIQDSEEDVQESVKGGVQEATKEARGTKQWHRTNHLLIYHVYISYFCFCCF